MIQKSLIAVVLLMQACQAFADEPAMDWVQTREFPAVEATQGAAADDKFVYSIANQIVAKYDRKTGERLSVSHGDAIHLNSGFLMDGKLYCAHSNFGQKPDRSEIKILDPESMELTDFHAFGETPHGSLTVALFDQGAWWCVFAVYGKQDNQRTVLVKYDQNWNEQAVFTFPGSVTSDLGRSSISGGVWRNDEFLATGHDKKVLYRLTLPASGTVLKHLATQSTPFPGQAIAIDPATGGLIGIRRPQYVLFAEERRIPGT